MSSASEFLNQVLARGRRVRRKSYDSVSDRGSTLRVLEQDREDRASSLLSGHDDVSRPSSSGSGKTDSTETKLRMKDEVFTDKDRAAAVVIGTKDLKESLEYKKLIEQRRKQPEDQGAIVFFTQSKFLMAQAKWSPAIKLLNKALQMHFDNKEWLVARAQCHIQLSDFRSALDDVETVLQLDKGYFPAVCQKAELMYILSDFEHALLYFHWGLKLRPGNNICRLGIQKSRTAVEASVPAKSRNRVKKSRKGKISSDDRSSYLPNQSSTELKESDLTSTYGREMTEPIGDPRNLQTGISQKKTSNTSLSETAISREANYARTSSPFSSETAIMQEDNQSSIALTENIASSNGMTPRPSSSFKLKITCSSQQSLNLSELELNVKHKENYSKTSYHGELEMTTSRASLSGATSGPTSFDGSNFSDKESLSVAPDSLADQRLFRHSRRSRRKTTPSVTSGTSRGTTISSDLTVKKKKKKKKSKKVPDFSLDLSADRRFLDNILSSKELRRDKNRRLQDALRLAEETKLFVIERQQFWAHEAASSAKARSRQQRRRSSSVR